MSRAALNHSFIHIACAIVAAAVWMMIAVVPGNSDELPLQSVVGGHRLQPNEQELNAVGHPDVSVSQSAEIDQLYGILLHCAASACAAEDSGAMPKSQCGAEATRASC